MMNRRMVRCPGCGGEAVYGSENRWRPFCSERCRQHDFGAWATERFRLPAQTPPDDAPEGSANPD